ncbi:glycerate kinase [Staphylococcus xylosus]|uniref:Glycerate kinase n=1 Tax=Staphylococcus xylosus TaxID=1288 RepID=A0A939NHN2_STAXY|nr:glycerate kinase [Staphylococcus xylosus]
MQDVKNPLIGQDGASHVFGKQRSIIFRNNIIRAKPTHWANIVESTQHIRLHELAGAGAAVV